MKLNNPSFYYSNFLFDFISLALNIKREKRNEEGGYCC